MFTIAFIYIDPTPHQSSYIYRSIILLLALAAHSILSKRIYAYPPSNVSIEQAELGAMIMYYGGDAIEIGFVFFAFFTNGLKVVANLFTRRLLHLDKEIPSGTAFIYEDK